MQESLPVGYTKVEYIRNTNKSAYIDTGIIIDDSCKVTFDFLIGSTLANKSIWGWRRVGNYSSKYQSYISANSGNKFITVGVPATIAGVGTSECFEYDVKNRIIIDFKNHYIKINGADVPSIKADFNRGYAFNSIGSSEYSPYIFAFNNIGETTAGTSSSIWTKLYGYKVEKNGIIIQNLVPCHDANNVYGVYDIIGKQFLTSPNGETFEYIG